MDASEKQSALFVQLVIMLHAAAMQNMGKIKNPVTDAVERSLPAAQGMIDLLDMLRARTRGNLTPEEAKLLDQMLHEVRLNYVDEMNKPEPQKNEGEGQR
jgi:hypothetical protein